MKKVTQKSEQPKQNQMVLTRVSFERYGPTAECAPLNSRCDAPSLPSIEPSADGRALFTGKQGNKFLEVSVIFNQHELDAIEAIAKGAIKRVNSSINS